MATYGKKKKLILPSFSILRDSTSTSKSKKDNNRKRGSTSHTTSATRGRDIQDPTTPRYDDSIEEMASMLLDDTDIDLTVTERGKHLSFIATPKTLSGTACSSLRDTKSLPQLPQMLFNGDDAWEMRIAPIVTGGGSNNQVHFSCEDGAVPGNHTSSFPQPAKQPTGNTPPIPRRPSNRTSGRPKAASLPLRGLGCTQLNVARRIARTSISPPKSTKKAGPSTIYGTAGVNDKIEAMIAATKALKPGLDNTSLQGPYVPVKKRRLKDNKVLAKVKTVLNDRLQARNGEKRQNSQGDEHLLSNSSTYDLPMADDSYVPSPALSIVSDVERRLNEGDNLEKLKIFSLTGHGNVRRKQVADDGKSLRSQKSISDDPFSKRPNSSGNTRTPTIIENRIYDEISIDQAADLIPDLPNQIYGVEELPRRRSKKARQSSLMYDAEFDALFSSSPQGQSTPRIRLEPSFEEDGKTTLRNVPADSRSLFDPDNLGLGNYSDMEVDTPSVTSDHNQQKSGHQRMSVRRRNSGVPARSTGLKKMKKHPSPSKAELETFERILTQYPNGHREDLSKFEDFSMAGVEPDPPGGVLQRRGANIKIPEPTQRDKVKTFGMFLKPNLSRVVSSIPDIAKRSKTQAPSKIPKVASGPNARVQLEARRERRFSTRDGMDDGSFMDTDELQWDLTALMGKV